MGTDPETSDYDPGNDCTVCVDVLFDGVTPKYVEADVVGIVKCIGVPDDPPSGTFLLTQAVLACLWQYTENGLFINWELRAGSSILTVGVPGFRWFHATVFEICWDAFVNQNVCGAGPVIGEDGYVTLWWGPTIGV